MHLSVTPALIKSHVTFSLDTNESGKTSGAKEAPTCFIPVKPLYLGGNFTKMINYVN